MDQFYFVAAIRLFNSCHKHLLSCGCRAQPPLRITATHELLVICGMKLNNDSNSYLHWSFVDQGGL